MPESSFFDPIGIPPGGFTPAKPRFFADPALRAGYQNIYGTRIGASVSPVTNQGSLDFQFPIGDHQKQNFITGGAYVRPGSFQAPSDYGFKLGFTKKIQPQGLSGGDLIDRALQQQVGVPNHSGPVLNASNRGDFFNSLTADQLKMLSQSAKQINRDYIDQQLGIRPGAEKFGFDVGVDVRQKLDSPPGMQDDPVMDPREFVQDYSKLLSENKRKPVSMEYD